MEEKGQSPINGNSIRFNDTFQKCKLYSNKIRFLSANQNTLDMNTYISIKKMIFFIIFIVNMVILDKHHSYLYEVFIILMFSRNGNFSLIDMQAVVLCATFKLNRAIICKSPRRGGGKVWTVNSEHLYFLDIRQKSHKCKIL